MILAENSIYGQGLDPYKSERIKAYERFKLTTIT